jgi:hypothetical protein
LADVLARLYLASPADRLTQGCDDFVRRRTPPSSIALLVIVPLKRNELPAGDSNSPSIVPHGSNYLGNTDLNDAVVPGVRFRPIGARWGAQT